MKAYHLSRAQNPAELPAWLFTARERGLEGSSWKTSETPYEDRFHPDAVTSNRRTGLREVYDSINVSSHPSSSRSPAVGNSQAVQRLRAIRQAKRSAVAPQQSEADTRDVVAPMNKGLPSGPKMPRSIRG